jgi:AcrR family transcriptional regulator
LRDQFRDATHRSILDSAEKVFAKGISSARMEDIANEAGVSVGTIYNHFSDRQALLGSVIGTRQSEMRAIMKDAMKKMKNRPFDEQLEHFMTIALETICRHYAFFLAAWQEESGHNAPSRHSMLLEFQAHAETLVKEGIKTGILRKDDAGLYPLIIVGMIRGVTRLVNTEKIGTPLNTLIPGLVRCFLKGAARK